MTCVRNLLDSRGGSIEALYFFIADRSGAQRNRRFHRDEREELHHVVLDDIAEKSFFFEKMAPRPDADIFGDCDLHMIDMAVIPERFENRIRKAENEEILDCFFAEIMVDPVNLRFIEVFGDVLLETFRRCTVVSKRFFDDDARPLSVVLWAS